MDKGTFATRQNSISLPVPLVIFSLADHVDKLKYVLANSNFIELYLENQAKISFDLLASSILSTFFVDI